jgi:hypothetical protein
MEFYPVFRETMLVVKDFLLVEIAFQQDTDLLPLQVHVWFVLSPESMRRYATASP